MFRAVRLMSKPSPVRSGYQIKKDIIKRARKNRVKQEKQKPSIYHNSIMPTNPERGLLNKW